MVTGKFPQSSSGGRIPEPHNFVCAARCNNRTAHGNAQSGDCPGMRGHYEIRLLRACGQPEFKRAVFPADQERFAGLCEFEAGNSRCAGWSGPRDFPGVCFEHVDSTFLAPGCEKSRVGRKAHTVCGYPWIDPKSFAPGYFPKIKGFKSLSICNRGQPAVPRKGSGPGNHTECADVLYAAARFQIPSADGSIFAQRVCGLPI